MGLDNGFFIKHNNTGDKCEIAYFRNYYELDDWIRCNCKSIEGDNEEYYIDKNVLDSLINYIKPIYDVIILVASGLINKYDEEGYPKSLIKKIDAVGYGNEFRPIDSRSSFAGAKLIHLYQSICQMLEMIEMNREYFKDSDKTRMKDWDIIFYSSY